MDSSWLFGLVLAGLLHVGSTVTRHSAAVGLSVAASSAFSPWELPEAFLSSLLVNGALRLVVALTVIPVSLLVTTALWLRRRESRAREELGRRSSTRFRPAGLPDLGDALVAADTDQEGLRRPAPWIWCPAVGMAFACNVNFTVAMPSAVEVAAMAGGGAALSGLVIATWAIGATLGLPLFYRCGLAKLKTCYMAHLGLVLLGGLLQVRSLTFSKSVWGFILGRLVQGAGGSINYSCGLSLTKGCCVQVRTEYLGYWFGGGALGVMCGPGLVWVAETCLTQRLHGCATGLEVPAALACVYGLAGLVFVARRCPSNLDLEDLLRARSYDVNSEPEHSKPSFRRASRTSSDAALAGAAASAQADLGLLLLLAAQLTRTMLRVAWESAALLHLEMLGLRRSLAAALVSLVAALHALGQILMAMVLRHVSAPLRPSDPMLVSTLEFVSIFGLLAMGMGESLLNFVLGSALFYVAIMLTGAPITSYAVSLGLPSSDKGLQQPLSVEHMLLMSNLLWLLSCAVAPIYSRAVLASGPPSAFALALMLAPVMLCQTLVSIICMDREPTVSQLKAQQNKLPGIFRSLSFP